MGATVCPKWGIVTDLSLWLEALTPTVVGVMVASDDPCGVEASTELLRDELALFDIGANSPMLEIRDINKLDTTLLSGGLLDLKTVWN